MMHAIVIGCSGAIAMNLTVCKKTSLKTMEATGCYDLFKLLTYVDDQVELQ